MQVRELQATDLAAINRWLKLSSEQHLTAKELPAITFVVPGVAFAGLRYIQGGYLLFDSMCTNPACSSETRHKALEAIYNSIFQTGIDLNCSKILGFTTDAGALLRAKAAGFVQLPHTVLSYSKG